MPTFLKNLLTGKKERDLTEVELLDLKHLTNLCLVERFKSNQMRNNTALFKNGPTVVANQEVLARLMEGVKEQVIAQKLTELGYEKNQKVSINLNTGKITKIVESRMEDVGMPSMTNNER